jgi:glycerol-3-phosphate acyltransferase PlsY
LDHSVWNTLAVTVAAYVLGSLSFAVIISRVMGLSDPRSYGSNNPGATNVLRSGNKKAAVLTLVFDAAKGWLPVFAVQHLGADYALGAGTAALVGIAAFVGHLFPVFFRFQGGKGVATAAGVLLGVSPLLGLSVALTWAIVAWFSRYSSLAALAAAVFAPAYYAFGGDVAWPYAEPILGALIVMGLLLVWRHIDNINRLVAGKESKLGAKTSKPVTTELHCKD